MNYNPRDHTFLEKAIDGFFTIALQLTRECNYDCIHCSESDRFKEMSTDEIRRVIDNLSKNGVKRINISGGEPTLRRDWLEIIYYISDKGINVSLATNASRLNEHNLRKLKGKVSNIRVSIYGAENTHDRITKVPGSFVKTENVARQSIDLGIPVYACMALMRQNIGEIAKVRDICHNAGMEKLLIYSLVPKGRGQDIHSAESVPKEEVKHIIERLGPGKPEIYWSPFEKDGICALIQADGSLVATPYQGDSSRTKLIGWPVNESLEDLWNKYPFKEDYLEFNREKMKC